MTTSNTTTEQNKDPDTLEREVDQARARLGHTVDALGSKLSPGELLDQALRMTREHGGEFGRNLGGQIKHNPLPLLLTGIGVAWMMSSTSTNHSASGYRSASPAAGSSDGAGLKARVRDGLSASGDKMSAQADQLKAGARQAHSALSDQAAAAGEGMREQALNAQQSVQALMRDQPLMVGALGVAFGAAIGALVPPTEAEDRLLGSSSDQVTGKAAEAVDEKYDDLRETAQHAAKQVQRDLQEAGTSATRQ